MDTKLFLGLCIALQTVTTAKATVCSEAERTSDLSACLTEIENVLFDSSRFWFGTQYATMCPSGPGSDIRCVNRSPNAAQGIIPRLFTKSEHNPNLDRYLKLTYESIEKNYTGCGVTYKASSGSVWRKEVDPVSDDVEEPWYLRNRPVMEWTYNQGEYFTLIVYDAGYPLVHAVYANIVGNDVMNSQLVKPYHGPTINTDLKNPYVFLLYKHNAMLDITDNLTDVITNNEDGALPNFVSALNLGGPVAVSIVTVTGDPYAAQLVADARFSYTCPIFSTQALLAKPRPFLPNTTSLSVWLDVRFETTRINFSACCKDYDISGKQFYLNPLGNPVYMTEDVRSEATVTYSVKRMGYWQHVYNFTGEMFSLITLDPDVPFPEAATEERPLLHGLVANIQNGDFTTGDTAQSYGGPTPPDNKEHWYYFLLYRQNGTVNATEMKGYTGDPNTCRVPGRCLYNINQVVADYGLELIGASWMKAETDPYVIYRRVKGDPSLEEGYCAGKPGYAKPCPTSGADILGISCPFLLLVSFILLL